jgi:hypothetical protein
MKPYYFSTTYPDNSKYTCFYLFRTAIWRHYREKGRGWIRTFGIGFKWKDITKHPLLFSERYGKARGLQIGKYRISFLKPL